MNKPAASLELGLIGNCAIGALVDARARIVWCCLPRIDALARISRKPQAREIFEAMLAARNPLGLLSEDTDPRSGELWGNFPQTYSMVGVINGTVRLSAPWDTVI